MILQKFAGGGPPGRKRSLLQVERELRCARRRRVLRQCLASLAPRLRDRRGRTHLQGGIGVAARRLDRRGTRVRAALLCCVLLDFVGSSFSRLSFPGIMSEVFVLAQDLHIIV